MNLIKRVAGVDELSKRVTKLADQVNKLDRVKCGIHGTNNRINQLNDEIDSINSRVNDIPDIASIEKIFKELDEFKCQLKNMERQHHDLNNLRKEVKQLGNDLSELKDEIKKINDNLGISVTDDSDVTPELAPETEENQVNLEQYLPKYNSNVKGLTDLYKIIIASGLPANYCKRVIGSLANNEIQTIHDLETEFKESQNFRTSCKRMRIGDQAYGVLLSIISKFEDAPADISTPVDLSKIDIKEMIWDTDLPMKTRCRVLKDLNGIGINTVENFKTASQSDPRLSDILRKIGANVTLSIDHSYRMILSKAQ